MLLASLAASTSQLFANFVVMLQHLAEWPSSQRKDTMSHLYFVLQQTHPSRRPDFAKYPTLISKAVFICDPFVWPNLAIKTVRILLSPTEIWRFMCLGPLVAPIPYLLFLCSLFCILNDPKVKSVKLRTWIITTCVCMSSMATLALVENTKGGNHTVEALFAGLAPLMDYLPSLQPLVQLVERASQAVGLPLRFLPSWLFLAKLGYHILLICRDVYHGWHDAQSCVAEDKNRRWTQQATREAASRADSEGGPPQDEDQRRQGFVVAMRRRFAVIEEQLALKAVHEANMQKILDEWTEADSREQIAAAEPQSEIMSLSSDLEGMEEDDNGIAAEVDGERDGDSPESQQPPVDDSQSLTGSEQGQTTADQLPQAPGNASYVEEEIAGQDYNSPDLQQPQVDQIQSHTSPARDQILAHQPLKGIGLGPPIEAEDGERTHSSFEHQRASVDFGISPTSTVEGQNLADELDGLHHYDSDYEDEVEEGDDDQGSPQTTHQTFEPSHGRDGLELEEEQDSPHSTQSDKSSQSANGPEDEAEQSSPQTIDQTADYSHSEYSNEGEEEQSSSPSVPSFHRTESRLQGYHPQSRRSVGLTELDDSQYFIDERDFRAVEDEIPRFLESVSCKPEVQRKSKEQVQTDRTGELTRMSGEQFGDGHVTFAELEDFLQEDQKENENTLLSDHLKELAEAQSFTSKADEHHDLRNFENFMEEGEAAEQARQRARLDGNEELQSFQQGQAFVNEEDEHHNARFLEQFVEDHEVEQQQEASRPDLNALSNAQSFVEEDEVAKTAQDVDGFIKEGEAEKKAQQASRPDLKVLSNAQSFVERTQIAQTAQEVNDFIEEGNAAQQRNEKTQADRKEELKSFQKGQAFVNAKDEQHNQRSLDNFIEEGEAEKQAQRASQPDLKAMSNAQAFVDEEDEQHSARSVDVFIEEGKTVEHQETQEEKQHQQHDLKTLKEAQFFGEEHMPDDDDEEHDTAAKESGGACSSTHDRGDDDDDDGSLRPIREEHEDDGHDANADNSDPEPEYTLSNTRDYYDE